MPLPCALPWTEPCGTGRAKPGNVASPVRTIVCSLVLSAVLHIAQGQDALPRIWSPNVTRNGLSFAQTNAAIEQSRLLRQSAPPAGVAVDANGNALPESTSTSSEDDSFGAQQILKSQERVRPFLASGGVSFIYTDNVALTRKGTRDDAFAVVDASLGWSPK